MAGDEFLRPSTSACQPKDSSVVSRCASRMKRTSKSLVQRAPSNYSAVCKAVPFIVLLELPSSSRHQRLPWRRETFTLLVLALAVTSAVAGAQTMVPSGGPPTFTQGLTARVADPGAIVLHTLASEGGLATHHDGAMEAARRT